MRPVYYDLHIHTALSPCADNDMTPNDIVGMALLNCLNLIAVTDHNSFANVEAVMKAAAGKDLIVLPGAEIETSEEVHVLCLFPDLICARGFEEELDPLYSQIPNRPDIFGEQIVYDEHDRRTGVVGRMLLAPVAISFDDLHSMTHKHGGAFIPAHVDRDSYSVLSNLGFLPPHLSIPAVEVSSAGFERGYVKKNPNRLPRSRVIISSDAHHLWNIADMNHFLYLPELSPQAAIACLSNETPGRNTGAFGSFI